MYGPEKDPLDCWSSSEDESEGKGDHTRSNDDLKSEGEGSREEGGGGVKERRFCSMSSGAKHVVFIRCSDEVDPTHLVHSMLSDIHATKLAKSRYIYF